ncbi:tetratricopeptide repeat protein [Litorimonas haliclonae]|uniref:tetratricopeptide repeat protein n=1 Tax=Litorimonas haliclonae TaxID=2081977 RepID=UPI0039EFAEE2
MIRSLLAALLLSLPVAASGQVMVVGSGDAENCYKLTRDGNPGTSEAIQTCRAALEIGLLQKDQAATHINTGILYMRAGDYDKSRDHYETAINYAPDLPEAYINYGAGLIYMEDYRLAIDALSTAIDLGKTKPLEKMPEALFNRALAYDREENYKAAYLDLRRALALRPDWPPASAAIRRYDVKAPS